VKLRITAVDLGKKSFQNSYKGLPDDIKEHFKEAKKELLKYPQPSSLRLHQLSGWKNPKIYTIDVGPNHSYKLSFELDGEIAIFRRVGTHKLIDRCP